MKTTELPDPNMMTLEEMYEVFASDAYKEFRENPRDPISIETLPDGRRYVSYTCFWHSPLSMPLLYRHICAEQLLLQYYHEVDWEEFGEYDVLYYVTLIHLWMHPLVWTNPIWVRDIVIYGSAAKEQIDVNRPRKIAPIIDYIEECSVLSFADNPPVCDEDEPESGCLKGMHFWTILTRDWTDLRFRALNGANITPQDVRRIRLFSAACLRKRLVLIAEKRSGKRAAELLRMLQDEWKSIRVWDIELKGMKEKDIKEFEDTLFNGFNDLLKEWEGSDLVNTKEQTGEELFRYIHYNVIEETDRVTVHRAIRNIVRLPKMAQVCLALKELKRKEQILSTIEPSAMLAELRRLGLPNGKGFSDQNFYSAYK